MEWGCLLFRGVIVVVRLACKIMSFIWYLHMFLLLTHYLLRCPHLCLLPTPSWAQSFFFFCWAHSFPPFSFLERVLLCYNSGLYSPPSASTSQMLVLLALTTILSLIIYPLLIDFKYYLCQTATICIYKHVFQDILAISCIVMINFSVLGTQHRTWYMI